MVLSARSRRTQCCDRIAKEELGNTSNLSPQNVCTIARPDIRADRDAYLRRQYAHFWRDGRTITAPKHTRAINRRTIPRTSRRNFREPAKNETANRVANCALRRFGTRE